METSLNLENFGRKHLRRIHRNLPTPVLYEKIVTNREGQLSHLGPIVIRTGHYSELLPEDKFIVKDSFSEEKVFWSDEKNELSENHFNTLFHRLAAYLHDKEVYVQDCFLGSVSEHQIPIRIITETAWHSLFARNMYYQIHDLEQLEAFSPEFTIIHIPGFNAIPEIDGTNSSAFVIFNLSQKLILIGGASYAGEIKQAVFTVASYLLPESVFCMRCAANVGPEGDVAIFLGREETGKTALAVDPNRRLLGDHVHGWTDKGIYNMEWGGYAKLFDLSPEEQPYIYDCTRRFGTLLENVTIDPDTRRTELSDGSLTKNTRAVYPISHLPNAIHSGLYDPPKNLFLLTCDAFGVLPAIARLTPEQAAYAFLSAYTSKFTQTESGEFEPQVMFNVCFGDTALALPAYAYGMQLLERIKANNTQCWLMNTGWIGEPSHKGERIRLKHSRALVSAVLTGAFNGVEFETDPVFQYELPKTCPGFDIPQKILNPREAAADDGDYELRANRLVAEFMKDFAQFEDKMPEDMRTMLSQIISVDDTLDLEEFGFSM